MPETEIHVFVNEDVTGRAVAILLKGYSLVEVDGELYPMVECAAMVSMRLAEAIVDCAGKVINGDIEDAEGT